MTDTDQAEPRQADDLPEFFTKEQTMKLLNFTEDAQLIAAMQGGKCRHTGDDLPRLDPSVYFPNPVSLNAQVIENPGEVKRLTDAGEDSYGLSATYRVEVRDVQGLFDPIFMRGIFFDDHGRSRLHFLEMAGVSYSATNKDGLPIRLQHDIVFRPAAINRFMRDGGGNQAARNIADGLKPTRHKITPEQQGLKPKGLLRQLVEDYLDHNHEGNAKGFMEDLRKRHESLKRRIKGNINAETTPLDDLILEAIKSIPRNLLYIKLTDPKFKEQHKDSEPGKEDKHFKSNIDKCVSTVKKEHRQQTAQQAQDTLK